MKKLLIIDTFNFLHRAYHALPKTFTDQNGEPTNAVFGVTSMLISVFNQLNPTHALAAVDSKEPTFRVEDFTGYKAQRKPMEEDLATQIPKVFEMIDAFGIKRIELSGYEADDVIATATERFRDDIEVIIVSNDRDLWQLVNGNVVIMLPGKKGVNEWVGKKEAEARMGFDVKHIADYKGLRGDPSDNIPGVYGVGEKTAKKLIEEFGTVEEIYRNLESVNPESLRKKLEENCEQALMSKKLAQLIMDAPFEASLDDLKYHEFNRLDVKNALEKYNFKSLIKRLGFDPESGKPQKEKDQVPDNQLSLF
jgi:DNA polymerase-1